MKEYKIMKLRSVKSNKKLNYILNNEIKLTRCLMKLNTYYLII